MIEETTARAFEALLHFLYCDALEIEDEFLVDVLRCLCCLSMPLCTILSAACQCACGPSLTEAALSRLVMCRLADRCQAQRLHRLCLARMKAALGPEHACRWLVEATKHSVADVQEPLLQYVTRFWGEIADENPESTEQLEEYPKLMRAIMLSPEHCRPLKRRRT